MTEFGARSRPVARAVARRLGQHYRWVILALCSLSVFQVTFHAYAYATLLPALMQELAIGNSQVGSLLSAYFITYGLVQIPIGYVADRFGSRRVMLASLSLFSIGVFLVPFSFNYWSGFATRLIVGLGASAIYVPGLRLIPNWFPQRRMGLVFGLISSGSAVGSSIALVLIPWLAGVFGWRVGYLIAAIGVPTMLVLIWLLLVRQPAEVGLAAVADAAGGLGGPPIAFLAALRQVVSSPSIWLYGLGTAIYYGGYAGILAWSPTFLIQDLGYPRETAGLITAIFPLANIITAPLAGAIGDRTGRRKWVFLAGITATGLSAVGFAQLAPHVGLPGHILMMLVISCATGATVLPFSIVVHLVPPAIYGTTVGLMNSFYFIGAVFYPVILGGVVDLTGVRQNAFYTIGALTLLGIGLVARARPGTPPPVAAPPAEATPPAEAAPAPAVPAPASATPTPADSGREPDRPLPPPDLGRHLDPPLRRRARRLLAPGPGHYLLELGPGLSDDPARPVDPGAPTGRVVRIDIAEVRRTTDPRQSAGPRPADRFRLRFFSGTFDRVLADRILRHRDSPQPVIAELARVTRPGGRIVLIETDWGSLRLEPDERHLTRRIVDSWSAGPSQSGVGGHLAALLEAAGLGAVRVEFDTQTLTAYAEADRADRLTNLADHAVSAGAITPAEAAAWLADLRGADRAGRFVCCLTRIVAHGRKD